MGTRGDGTVAELASHHQIHPNTMTKWKREAPDGMTETLARDGKGSRPDQQSKTKTFQAKIGEPMAERNYI